MQKIIYAIILGLLAAFIWQVTTLQAGKVMILSSGESTTTTVGACAENNEMGNHADYGYDPTPFEGNNTFVLYNQFTAADSGKVCKVYFKPWETSSGTVGIKVALYDNASPSTRLTSIITGSINGSSLTWQSVDAADWDFSLVATTVYRLAFIVESNDLDIDNETGGSGIQGYLTSQTYSSGPPASATWNTTTWTNRYSMYLTYE